MVYSDFTDITMLKPGTAILHAICTCVYISLYVSMYNFGAHTNVSYLGVKQRVKVEAVKH